MKEYKKSVTKVEIFYVNIKHFISKSREFSISKNIIQQKNG